jgi:hypothetical protein
MRTPPASPSRAPSAGDVVEHSGRQWHMDVAAMHATNFRVDRPDGGGVAGPDSGAGGYVVYDIEIVPGLAATASADSRTIERLHKRWSQVEALHTELVEELPNLPWREIVFPKKWVKTLDESDIEKRLRDMNAYYFALIQLFTKSRTPLRTTTAFGRFLAEPATFAGGDEARHTPQQLADIRAQSESDASDAAELKEAAKLAAERIVKADIRKAQQAGLDYDTFRKEYRPVGGDAVSICPCFPRTVCRDVDSAERCLWYMQSLHKLWEEFSEGSSSATGKHRASGTGGNGGGGGSDGSSGGGWEALDLSRAPLSCDTMDPADTPKRAVVSCYVNDILKVDLVDEVFTPLLSFTLDWTDDGAIERSSSGTSTGWALKVEEDELWRPFMDFENLVEKAESLDDTVGVFTQGGRPIVSQFRRHINVLRPHKLDLREFPFDTMNLDVVLSFGWDSKELEVVPGVIEAADMVHSSSEYVLTGLDAHVTDRRYGYFERYDDSNGADRSLVFLSIDHGVCVVPSLSQRGFVFRRLPPHDGQHAAYAATILLHSTAGAHSLCSDVHGVRVVPIGSDCAER